MEARSVLSEQHVQSAVPIVEPKSAFRLCVEAICKKDANNLCKAISSTSMPIKLAMSIASQAWNADVAAGKVGVRMHSGGLLCAVFLGTTESQKCAGTMAHGDNAVTLIAGLAAERDEPAILDVLLNWEPTFRMGPQGEASIETTANFFMDADAPKCASRIMQRKHELVMEPKQRFLREHAKEKAVRNAKRIIEKGTCPCPLGIAALEDLIEDDGDVQVASFDTAGDGKVHIVTIGFSLIGKPEIVSVCTPATKDAVRQSIVDIARKVQGGDDNVPGLKPVELGKRHMLNGLLSATKHLRPANVPSVVVFS